MAELTPIFTQGSAAVSAGGTTVTLSGAPGLSAAGIRAGDQFKALGLIVTITAEPTSNVALSIKPWPGANLAAAAGNYEILRMPDANRMNATVYDFLQNLTPRIASLALLSGTAVGSYVTMGAENVFTLQPPGSLMVGATRDPSSIGGDVYDARRHKMPTRAEAEASLIPVPVEILKVRHRGIVLNYTRAPELSAGTAALTTTGPVHWKPADPQVLLLHFGSAEDYDVALNTGTNDYAAFERAFAYLALPAVQGGSLYITYTSLTNTTLVLPESVILRPVTPAYQMNTVGGPKWGSNTVVVEGSRIVGGMTSGPVVWARNSKSGTGALTIRSTEARWNAGLITSGGVTNCGILMAPADVASAVVNDCVIEGTFVRDQPSDLIHISGASYWEVIGALGGNAGRHGIVIENGRLLGRTNLNRAGLGDVWGGRMSNTGGHLLLIGNMTAADLQPLRINIHNFDAFRFGNNLGRLITVDIGGVPTALRAGGVIIGEQIRFIMSAIGATTGYTGNVALTGSYSVAIAGRNIHLETCRYIGVNEAPVVFLNQPAVPNVDVKFRGAYCAGGVTITRFADFLAGAVVKDFGMEGFGGNLSSTFVPVIEANLPDGSHGFSVHANVRKNYLEASLLNINQAKRISVASGAVGFVRFTATGQNGHLFISALNPSSGGGIIDFRVHSSSTVRRLQVMADPLSLLATSFVTSTPLGGSGTAGKLNLMVDTNDPDKIYFVNNTGVAGVYMLSTLANDITGGLII